MISKQVAHISLLSHEIQPFQFLQKLAMNFAVDLAALLAGRASGAGSLTSAPIA